MTEIAFAINRQIGENLNVYEGPDRLKALRFMNDQALVAYHTSLN